MASTQINRALKQVRLFHSLSQKDAAEKLGISQPEVSQLEGDRSVSLATIELYATTFSIPVSNLLWIAEQPKDPQAAILRTFLVEKTLRLMEFITTQADIENLKESA